MKLKITAVALLCSGLLTSPDILATNHTFSLGYAQSKIEGFDKIRGVNAQYRYEWHFPLSVMGSLSYMVGDQSYSERVNNSGYDGKAAVKYASLLAGPTYRINDYVSLYALIGMAFTQVKDRTTYLTQYSESVTESKTSAAYGAGVVVNPTKYLSVSAGYEGTRVRYNDNVAINGFNVGVGYRF